ncbi:MAG: hypothetical protein NTV19_19710 [Burkholderiales bacterium]|nr:hypothetical protein [Burkholderiales bacterium]
MQTRPASSVCLAVLLIPAALVLGACGGGGSSSASSDGGTLPSPTELTLTGTAATSAAIAGKTVEAKCGSGNGSALSGATGNFRVTIGSGATLPCLLRVTTSDGTVLHSAAAGSGNSAVANITPVSELALARLSGGTPAGYFGSFDATAAAALSGTRLQTAVSAVVDTLKSVVDFSTVGDVLSGTLVAANGAVAGNPMGQALDALNIKLASSGTTLGVLTDAVARSAPNAPASGLSAIASLPANVLLNSTAANCGALRSGRYRMVANDDRSPGYATEVVTVDAATLRITNANAQAFTMTAAGTCRYTTPNGGAMAVTAAGVIISQIDSPPFRGAVFFPEQSHAVADLAGEWNGISLDRTEDNGPIQLTTQTVTFGASGRLTGGVFCDVSGCETPTASDLPNISMNVNGAGGFDVVNASDSYTDRLFAYRAGGGELMLVALAAGGHITFLTRKVASSLPAIGALSQGWGISLVPNTQPPEYTSPGAITQYKSTVTSLDATAARYARSAVFDFPNNLTRTETIAINFPRDGYLRRLPGTVIASNGTTSSVTEWVGLTLRGMGLTATGSLNNNHLGLFAAQAQ